MPADGSFAAAATTTTAITGTATLPTRATDWPAPGAAALAAWQGAPAAKPAASASANPAASAAAPLPVFPYQWIGQLDDGGAPQVLLASSQRSVGVRRGAVLDCRWRLDRAPGEPWKATHLPSGLVVTVRGARSVTVLALPINIIAGLLGMNVGGIPLADSPHGFLVIALIVLGFTVVAGWLAFRRRD